MRSVMLVAAGAVILHALVFAACSRDTAPPQQQTQPTQQPTTTTASASSSLLPPDAARDIVLGRCTICHDESYLGQQRLGVDAWQKTVAKMQGFGAPVTAEDAPVVAAYLAKSFPLAQPDVEPRSIKKPASGMPPKGAP